MANLIYLAVFALVIVSAGDSKAQYLTKGLDLDENISKWYELTIGTANSRIFEGSYYHIIGPMTAENQYFKQGQWTQGALCFDGQVYDTIDLLYNTFEDLLILRNTALHFSNAQPTLINQQRIECFKLQGRHFVHLKDSVVPSSGPGFYEKLFDGNKIDFYIKRIKNDYVQSGQLVYKEEDKYFIGYNGSYTRYKGKKSIYRLFPAHKVSLKQVGNKLKVRFREGEEDDLIHLLKYCDQLLSGL